jgi:hypothetical protein
MSYVMERLALKEFNLNTFRFELFSDDSLIIFSKNFRIGTFYYPNFSWEFYKFKTTLKIKRMLFPKQTCETFSLNLFISELQDFKLYCDCYNDFFILQIVNNDFDLCLIQVNKAPPLSQTKWLVGGYNDFQNPLNRKNGITKKRGLIIYDYRELSFVLEIIRNKETLPWKF